MPTKQKYAISLKAVRLLRRVVKHILAEPRRYNQGTYGQHDKASPCGTAACIAGWAVILNRYPKPSQAVLDRLEFNYEDGPDYELYGPGLRVGNIDDRALRLIGPKADEANLFTGSPGSEWPEPFSTRWSKAATQSRRARVAADRIEHFIQTGE